MKYEQPTHADNDCARLDVKSRTSATSGNGIGITQSTHVGKDLKSKPNSVAAEPAISLSDEDDTTERAAILQSPLKGMNRLSSAVRCPYMFPFQV
jgi:hypothetical protein